MAMSCLGCAPVSRRRLALGTFDGVRLGHRAVIAGSDGVHLLTPSRAVVGEAPALL
jgi:FAD synthase